MDTNLKIEATDFLGLLRISRSSIADKRGFFSRVFCYKTLQSVGWGEPISQINFSKTLSKGSIRGLHYQKPPHSEIKVVSCLYGSILDVAVDLRKNSKTFLHWHAEELSGDNENALLIPKGFAHGFQTLTENCEVLYLHSSPYAPNSEDGIRFDDPMLNINWPLPVKEISSRDKSHKLLTIDFEGLEF